ncbi:MAG: hypothetical protein QXH24_02490 [Candidatus Bathyarchaeia archaeon]
MRAYRISLNRIRLFMLETQRIREDLAEQLRKWITRVEHEAEQTKDLKIKGEWTRLLGFLSQTLNSIMKVYDEVRLDEDIQKAREILDELERLKEKLDRRERELEAWERRLQAKEEELVRREQALQAKQTSS